MAGRPPSEKTFSNMLRVAISEAHESGGTKLRAVADALVTKALSGDVPAIKEVADRLEGKVAQVVDMDANLDVSDPLAEMLARIAAAGGSLVKASDDSSDQG